MSNTIKTIAWICLILGLLGLATDIGMYVHGRTMAAQFAERIEAGDFPGFQGKFRNEDSDEILPGDGFERRGRGVRPLIPGRRGGFGDRFGFGLPILYFAAGPILTVVGAVMLIVNREPKVEQAKPKKAEKQKV